jgi:hypothetical protein
VGVLEIQYSKPAKLKFRLFNGGVAEVDVLPLSYVAQLKVLDLREVGQTMDRADNKAVMDYLKQILEAMGEMCPGLKEEHLTGMPVDGVLSLFSAMIEKATGSDIPTPQKKRPGRPKLRS